MKTPVGTCECLTVHEVRAQLFRCCGGQEVMGEWCGVCNAVMEPLLRYEHGVDRSAVHEPFVSGTQCQRGAGGQ